MFTYKYPRPALTADVVLFDKAKREVLLISRNNEPFKGCWALPGGFFDMDDATIEATALRELKEETGLDGVALEEFCTASRIGRDPRERTVSVVFTGFADSDNAKATAGDDAREARWFPIGQLPPLAFDHNEILDKAIKARLGWNTGDKIIT